MRRRTAHGARDRAARVDPGVALTRGHQLARSRGHGRVVHAAPRRRDQRPAHHAGHGRPDVVPALQPVAPHVRRRHAAPHASLHHLSFEMRGVEENLFGTGRLLRAGIERIWGPGKHLAGNNMFNYFLDPSGNTMEYTTALEIIDEATWEPHQVLDRRADGRRPVGDRQPDGTRRRPEELQRARPRPASSPRLSDRIACPPCSDGSHQFDRWSASSESSSLIRGASVPLHRGAVSHLGVPAPIG